MNNALIRSTLHEEIDKSDDRLLNMIYALIKAYNPATAGTDAERQRLILQERENYLSGEVENYSWDQVKSMARIDLSVAQPNSHEN